MSSLSVYLCDNRRTQRPLYAALRTQSNNYYHLALSDAYARLLPAQRAVAYDGGIDRLGEAETGNDDKQMLFRTTITKMQ